MVELKIGETYEAHRVRSGSNDRGLWELISVRDAGKSRKAITIWPDNKPSGVKEGGKFRVKVITSVKNSARQDPKGGWRDDVSITAEVEPLEVACNPLDIDASDFDDSLFNDDNPFFPDDSSCALPF